MSLFVKFTVMVLLLSLCQINSIKKLKQDQIQDQQAISSIPSSTAAGATTTSVAAGNFAGTLAHASAIATQGNGAVGVAQGVANTNTVGTQASAVAIAAPTNGALQVQNDVLQATTQTLTTGQVANSNIATTKNTQYDSNVLQTTNPDNTLSVDRTKANDVATNALITGNGQTITDKTNNVITLTGSTATGTNTIDTAAISNIIIEVNSGTERLIIEKLISSDDRVIIVSAAKYLLEGLVDADKAYIKHLLYNETCNCKKIKDYVMELLSESV